MNAKILSVFAILVLSTSLAACNGGGVSNQTLGLVGGAAVGGLVGNAVTGGSTVGTVVGAAAGGLVGNQIGKNAQ